MVGQAGWTRHGLGMLRAHAVLAVLCCAWFVLGLIHAPAWAMLAWLPVPLCAALGAAQCYLTSRDATVSPDARKFWQAIMIGIMFLGASAVASIWETLPTGGVAIGNGGVLVISTDVAAVVTFLSSLVRLPLRAQTKQDRLTLWYDFGIVMLAAALFIWHFSTRKLVGQLSLSPSTIVPFVETILGCVVLFGFVKVTMAGTRSLEQRALRVLAVGAIAGIGGSATSPFLGAHPYLNVFHFTVPVATAFAAWSTYIQRHPRPPRPDRPQRKRTFALTPYIAVAATDGLLIMTTLRPGDGDGVVVAGGAVLLTALVVVRQLTSFQENARLLATLARHERRFRSLVQNSSDIVAITAVDGTLTYLSPSVARVLGLEAEGWLGRSLQGAIHLDDLLVAQAAIAQIANHPGATTTCQIRLAHRDGSWRWVEVLSSNLLDDPSVNGFVSNVRDITEARQLQDRLRYEATHDPLTGLANRALFAQRLPALLTAGGQRSVVVALIDLDGFKTINDTRGHAAGDLILTTVARRLQHNVRPTDTVARLGGDEFALLLDDITPAAADALLDRLHHALAEPIPDNGHEMFIAASTGVARGHRTIDPDELLRHADLAMYATKSRRDGTHTHYTPELAAAPDDRTLLAAEFRHALAAGQFQVLYQPVVNLPDGGLKGVEALLRWQHPDRGLVAPDQFIPAAEQTGLIVDLGRWVLREACEQAARWQAELGDDAPGTVAVNVSARQLRESAFADEVSTALRDSGLPAGRLILEITESIAVSGGRTDTNLHELTELGVRISLDDFGTGLSTLSLLHALPVSQLKLDRSFVDSYLESGRRNIATAVIALATALGLDAVAEGIETPQQAQHLHTLGYRSAQGYLFHRPMLPEAITALIVAAHPTTEPLSTALAALLP